MTRILHYHDNSNAKYGKCLIAALSLYLFHGHFLTYQIMARLIIIIIVFIIALLKAKQKYNIGFLRNNT